MASTATTVAASESEASYALDVQMHEQGHSTPSKPPPHNHHGEAAEELQAKLMLAAQEGHDADIPSNIGYVLDEKGKQKRRDSIVRRSPQESTRRHHHRHHHHQQQQQQQQRLDVEKTVIAGDWDQSTDDENVVIGWDGPDDPENPYNWPYWRKAVNCALISSMTFVAPLGSSIFAPGVPEAMAEFKSESRELAAFVVSVYVLGFAAGPLLFAPLSEVYGRTWVYHFCNLGFVSFLAASALAPSLDCLIAFRFLSGMFGGTPITNGGGSIADMIPQESRAVWMSVFALGPLMGPVVGPVVGGFVSGGPGWRWCFWILVIVGGFIAVAQLVFLKETYAPVILERKAERLRKETGNQALRSKLDVGLSPADYFKKSIIRPFKILARSPLSLIFALYIAVIYGYLYLIFTSLTDIFMKIYGFSTDTVGLSYLGLGIGSIVGLVIYSWTSDRYVAKKLAEDNEALAVEGLEPLIIAKPEYRLPPMLAGAPLLPIGLFVYGWTAEHAVHWMVPILGMLIIGVGFLLIFIPVQMYLVDAFHTYAASALAGNTVVRSVAGAVLPLAGLPMYDELGVGWGNSVLGFIAVALTPLPFFILKYGEYMRKRFDLKNL